MLNNGAARKAGIELKRVVCDTQTHSIPVEVKVGTKKKMEKKEFSGGAVTLTLRTTNPIKANHLVGALAELVHGQPNSSHQWTLRQLDEAFTKTGKLKKSHTALKNGKVHDVHAIISESAGTLYHRIRLTYRDRGLDIEIRTWKPEHFDLTGRTKSSTNPSRMESGFVHSLRELEKSLKEHGVPVQWPKKTRAIGYQSVGPLKR